MASRGWFCYDFLISICGFSAVRPVSFFPPWISWFIRYFPIFAEHSERQFVHNTRNFVSSEIFARIPLRERLSQQPKWPVEVVGATAAKARRSKTMTSTRFGAIFVKALNKFLHGWACPCKDTWNYILTCTITAPVFIKRPLVRESGWFLVPMAMCLRDPWWAWEVVLAEQVNFSFFQFLYNVQT